MNEWKACCKLETSRVKRVCLLFKLKPMRMRTRTQSLQLFYETVTIFTQCHSPNECFHCHGIDTDSVTLQAGLEITIKCNTIGSIKDQSAAAWAFALTVFVMDSGCSHFYQRAFRSCRIQINQFDFPILWSVGFDVFSHYKQLYKALQGT